jgi:asparagine synthase (glutamine-hydrolysing)
MIAALGHRGPDSEGSLSFDECTLVMTRLAVLDPQPRSDQPMQFARRALVYNGEIYNYLELRHVLERRGHHFETSGDTEVLLHALVEWGVAGGCERLEGMFAFALWDDRDRSLSLARDPLGIKPLYWHGTARGIAAASEATPLAEAFSLSPRSDAIREFLRFGSPVSVVAYEGIAELEPGTVLTWRPDHTIGVVPFDTADTGAAAPAVAVQAAITKQLRSDRPTVVLLSGGFDSALIGGIAARHDGSSVGLTLETNGNGEDVDRARKTARHYGLDHQIARVEERDLLGIARDFLDAVDQPTIDGLNTYLVSRAVIDRGFPVALSGLGGDETLGGYGYSRKINQLKVARLVTRAAPGELRHLIIKTVAASIQQPGARLQAILDAPSVAATWMAWRSLFEDDEIRRLTGHAPPSSSRWFADGSLPVRSQFRALDFSVYLRATCLRDTDVASMANSGEVRVPLLDAGFVHSTDRAGVTKGGLAALLGDEFLASLAGKPKLPFSLPWARWLPLLEADFEDPLADGGPLAGVIDIGQARQVLARDDHPQPVHTLRRWALLVLASWLQRKPSQRRPAPRAA